jgi:hypothetical protein
MKRYFLLPSLLIASAFMTGTFAQNTAKGTVYEDLNGNQKKERKEKGIAGVAVSNGREVVLTDAQGRYELPVENDNIIFVIKPSGYNLPQNESNLPQFFHYHKPQGSPELKYEGVAATGKLPRSVDFGLRPAETENSFRMLVFGDPQPYTREQVDFFHRGIVKEVKGINNVAFGLSLGDLVGDHLELFNPYIDAIKEVGIPWFNVMGNHDMNFDVEADSLSDETYEKHFGPANYAFNHGKVHFIILDDILYPDPRDGHGYWGGFRKDQLAFVKNDLKHVPKDHLVVLAFHIPLSEGEFGDSFNDDHRQKLFDLLADYPHTLSLSAHTHTQNQHFFGKEDGWHQNQPHHHYNVGTTSGDWYSGKLNNEGVPVSTMRDGTPKGYAFITFEGASYQIKYKAADQPADYQMEIFVPKVVAHNERTSARIVTNFFMGSERDSLFVRVDEGEWKKMRYINTYDPSYLHLLHEWDYADELMPGRRPSNPSESSHLWMAPIKTDLEPGIHTIEVKAHDQFGQVHKGRKTYRIATRSSSEE